MKKRIKIKKSRLEQVKDSRRAERKLHQDIPRPSVVESGKAYDRKREKKACKDWEE